MPFDPADTRSAPAPLRSVAPPRPRDPRLDVARGLGMFIILIAHIPENGWASFIPARFGYSDAADLFVFCSGMASALAFGALFEARGWLMGAARIIHRVWQVYWAHIGSFVVTLALAASADALAGGRFYVDVRLNLAGFFEGGADNLARLATLVGLGAQPVLRRTDCLGNRIAGPPWRAGLPHPTTFPSRIAAIASPE